MSLLTEYQEFEYQVLEDDRSPGGKMLVGGIFQKSDKKNANGRIYRRSLWNRTLGDDRVQRKLREKRMLGELDHPADGRTSLARVAMAVTELQIDDTGVVHGKYEVFNTPHGQILRELHRSGVKLGISSRGDGEVSQTSEGSVVNDDTYKLETFDVVLDPSVEEAFPLVLRESLQKADEITRTLTTKSLPDLVEQFNQIATKVREACARPSGPTSPKEESAMAQSNSLLEAIPAEHHRIVNLLVSEARQVAVDEAKTKLGKVDEDVARLTTENADLVKRLKAAEDTAQELFIQAKTHAFNERHLKDGLDGFNALKERYQAAVEIIDEMADKMRGSDGLGARLEAAEQIAAASLELLDDIKVTNSITSLLAVESVQVADVMKPILLRCESVKEVKKAYKSLHEATSKLVPATEPVADKGGKVQITAEDKKAGGKPIDQSKVVEDKKVVDLGPQSSGNGRVLESQGRGRAEMIALSQSLVKHRQRLAG